MSVEAFELVTVIEKLTADPAKVQVSALECWEEHLYVGTSDGHLLHYRMETGKGRAYRCLLSTKQRLLAAKPIEKLQIAPRHKVLIVLCDAKVFLNDMLTLIAIDETRFVKNAVNFARDESQDVNEGDAVHISVSKKKGLSHHDLLNGQLTQPKDLKENDDAPHRDITVFARDGDLICVAEKNKYHITDIRKRQLTELFPFEPRFTKPIIKRIAPREFLLSAWAEGLTMGMFVRDDGGVPRPPVQWPVAPDAVAYKFPYIVALCAEQGLIIVHSILDQQNKQVLSFPNGVALNDSTGRIFVASDSKVSVLVPVSFERQVGDLLSDRRVVEAITLAQSTMFPDGEDIDPDKLDSLNLKMTRIKEQGAWAYISLKRFKEAFELFADIAVNPRDILSFYSLLPAGVRGSEPDPVTPDRPYKLSTLAALIPEADDRRPAYTHLAGYLALIRGSTLQLNMRNNVDTALAQAYGVVDEQKLVKFASYTNYIEVDHCADFLRSLGRHHALAIIYHASDLPRIAFDIWRKLQFDELQDPAYPGVGHVITCLRKCRDVEAVFLHTHWALKCDSSAVTVFTQRDDGDGAALFRYDDVLAFLHEFGEAVIHYLEFLVFTLKNESEKYQTMLGNEYLQAVLKHRQEKATVGDNVTLVFAFIDKEKALRAKLQKFLNEKSRYRIDSLLLQIEKTDLYVELTILYGKLGEHEKAIHVLVHRLEDHKGAELYCLQHSSSTNRDERQRLFMCLLRVYLVPVAGEKEYSQQAMTLLNSHLADLNVAEVLRMVPQDWTIRSVAKFLTRSVRDSIHTARSLMLEANLARREHSEVSSEFHRLRGQRFRVGDESRCDVCKRYLGESPVAQYPNGLICHLRCVADKNQCPVTGTRFDTLSYSL
eukprot:m.464015 g.464015  ORF g.464015 m.464015 type:complete len:882 (-) comp57045_c1_seq4:1987-4632(-)